MNNKFKNFQDNNHLRNVACFGQKNLFFLRINIKLTYLYVFRQMHSTEHKLHRKTKVITKRIQHQNY